MTGYEVLKECEKHKVCADCRINKHECEEFISDFDYAPHQILGFLKKDYGHMQYLKEGEQE